ncbi:uncharacterized protein LOC129600812 isoform X2 [Paramacrobiotus metropolitanus]|uniref:uncharacterized protein LOC129600812 isoform X2 n=1 Tax=Paramacrobiotus metropolitanus TaxID=2943436 RepID=UPI0024465831|nr:uncharacterized protein LOC129600812 isoform X2 [Paramacrobiotus metropolitanus]
MDSLWPVMPRYRPLLVEANQMSYQNTVAVRRSDDTWWLGYIQDMDGDHAFIHFDSKTVEARWIHSGAVWPLPFFHDTRQAGFENIPVFVALRDEENGPLRFRPAVMLEIFQGCDFCYLFYIRTAGHDQLVYNGQITSQLPPTGPPLLQRRSGMLYAKHFIPFARANAVLSDASDKFRVIKHARKALRRNMDGLVMWRCCRFHLRIEQAGCMFIVLSQSTDEVTTQWTVATLAEMLDTHLASRIDLPPIGNRILHESSIILPNREVQASRHPVIKSRRNWKKSNQSNLAPKLRLTISSLSDVEVDALHPTASIGDLSPFIVEKIFSHLDLHSQMKTKRSSRTTQKSIPLLVCALWLLLLNNPRMHEHISISLDACWDLKSDSDNCFKAASLLYRTITATTISLTLVNVFPDNHFSLVRDLLATMQIRLPLLVLKDHTFCGPGTIAGQPSSLLTHPTVSSLLAYRDTCDAILLLNCTVAEVFCRVLYDIFQEEPGYLMPDRRLPRRERKFMRKITDPWGALAIDKLQSTIPRLFLMCSDGELHMTSRFMHAVNNNFPPVTAEMLAKVTSVHARWVRTLTYPDEWHSMRNYCFLFSGFDANGMPQTWDKADLRLVDVQTLSRMAIHGINEVFRV